MIEPSLIRNFKDGTLSEEEKNALIHQLIEDQDRSLTRSHHVRQLHTAVSGLAVTTGLWSSPNLRTKDLTSACMDLAEAFKALQKDKPDFNIFSMKSEIDKQPDGISFAMRSEVSVDNRTLKVNALIPEALMSEVDHHIFALYGVEATRVSAPINALYELVDHRPGEGPWVYLSGASAGKVGGLMDLEETKDLLECVYREMERADSPCSKSYLTGLEQRLILLAGHDGVSLEGVPYWLIALKDILVRHESETLCPQILSVEERIKDGDGESIRHWRLTSDTVELSRRGI